MVEISSIDLFDWDNDPEKVLQSSKNAQEQLKKEIKLYRYSEEDIKGMGLSVDRTTVSDVEKRLNTIQEKSVKMLKIGNSSKITFLEERYAPTRQTIYNLLKNDPYFQSLPEVRNLSKDNGFSMLTTALAIIRSHSDGVLDKNKQSIFDSVNLQKITNYDMHFIKTLFGYQLASNNYKKHAKDHGYGIDGIIGPHTWHGMRDDLQAIAIKQKNQISDVQNTTTQANRDVGVDETSNITEDKDISVVENESTASTQDSVTPTVDTIQSTTDIKVSKEQQEYKKQIRNIIFRLTPDRDLADWLIKNIESGNGKCETYRTADLTKVDALLFDGLEKDGRKILFVGKDCVIFSLPNGNILIHNKTDRLSSLSASEYSYLIKTFGDKSAKELKILLQQSGKKGRKWGSILVNTDGQVLGSYIDDDQMNNKLAKQETQGEKQKQREEEKAEKDRKAQEFKTQQEAKRLEDALRKAQEEAEAKKKVQEEAEAKKKAQEAIKKQPEEENNNQPTKEIKNTIVPEQGYIDTSKYQNIEEDFKKLLPNNPKLAKYLSQLHTLQPILGIKMDQDQKVVGLHLQSSNFNAVSDRFFPDVVQLRIDNLPRPSEGIVTVEDTKNRLSNANQIRILYPKIKQLYVTDKDGNGSWVDVTPDMRNKYYLQTQYGNGVYSVEEYHQAHVASIDRKVIEEAKALFPPQNGEQNTGTGSDKEQKGRFNRIFTPKTE